MTRKSSGLSKPFEPILSNLVKGKSMPSLRFLEDNRWDIRRPSKAVQALPMANPIITVTEHTPTPSPDYLRRQGSIDSQIDGASLSGQLGRWQQDRKSSLTRSQTDSNITYTSEDIPEAPGSICYITKDGDIDFYAVYRTSMRESSSCTLRVLEVILNLLELLIDMGILKQTSREESQTSPTQNDGETSKKSDKEKIPTSATHTSFGGESFTTDQNMSPHKLAMNTVVRMSARMCGWSKRTSSRVPQNAMPEHTHTARQIEPKTVQEILERLCKSATHHGTDGCFARLSGLLRGSHIITLTLKHMHQSATNVDENDPDPQGETSYAIDDKGVVRKLLFKKRSTSSTCPSLLETDTDDISRSNQSPLGNLRKKHHILTPRQSEKALGIALESITIKAPKRSKMGSLTNWFKKGDSQSVDDGDLPDNGDSFNDSASFIRQPSKYYQHKGSGKSHVSHTLQKAKRRLDDKLKFLKKGKKKDGSLEDSGGGSKCEYSTITERSLNESVNIADFSRKNSLDFGDNSRESEVVFLKERKLIPTGLVYNGTQRLSFLMETCPPGTVPDAFLLASSLDLWPTSMKLAFPMYRPSGPLPARGSSNAGGNRRSHVLQRAAGKMFHQWAEVISHRLEEMIAEDQQLQTEINAMVSDPDKQKELQIQDEEEDYLDEASIYTYGSNCPMPLRLIACVLLQEITAFLRETYQNLPKSSRIGGKERPPPWEKFYSKEANRRWSMALSSMGHSQTSAQSLQSIAGDRDAALGQAERKISFVLHEPDESEASSNTTVTMQPGVAGEVSGEESPGVLSDDQPPESPSDSNESDDTTKNMPWLKVMVQISNNMYFFCNHQNFCHPFCHRRVMRGCSRLVKAVRKVYGEEFGIIDDKFANEADVKKKSNKKDKNNRKVSDQTSSQVSPIRRKDSMGKKDRIDKTFNGSQASKLASKDSSRDIADSDGGNGSSKTIDDSKPLESPPILKYIQTQIKDGFHAPLAALLKGAVILTEENFADLIPVVWELLLEMNQEVSAAAASLFILGSVKAPSHVTEIMQHGLSNSDPVVRINAILR
ncbi:hypothetical protein D910_04110 [Dendroctonus ponderosae]|uniref:Protein UNC80 central region domain-containing protein n=1 Tax=Dendroctonus ponderosae TaxID=77166 RepID=U4TYI9_DENPD|nr:hypothetical protein D910_04110 [Dendroctonus ponderosae]